jgi:hypothetical protein
LKIASGDYACRGSSLVFALPVTFGFERDEISVRSVVFCARGGVGGIERCRVGFRDMLACGDKL